MSFKIDENVQFKTPGLNKYHLLQGASDDLRQLYEEMFTEIEGSLTQVLDNDASSKIKVAIENYNPTKEQIETLKSLQDSFRAFEGEMDPERLQFDIEKINDQELCIYRKSDNGISNLIINDDGSSSFSFISFKNNSKPDIFKFYDKDQIPDCELLALNFFSY